MLTSFTSGIEK